MGYYEDLAAKQQKAGEIKRLSTLQHDWEANNIIIGRFLGRVLQKSTKRGLPDFYLYTTETDGGPVTWLGSGSFDKREGAAMVAGEVYRVEYKGKRDLSGGRTMKVYDVWEILEPEREEASEASESEEA